jgi:Tol biopolymer transport system component
MRTVIVVAALSIVPACTTAATSTESSTPVTSPSPAASPTEGGVPIDTDSLKGRIVFSDETNDIWSMRADGSRVRRLTSAPAQEFDPTWSPDGRRIAYRHQTEDDETTEIYVMDADGSHQTNLTRNEVADWGPDWSLDGDAIAFNSAMETEGFGLYGFVVAPDGTGLRRISDHYVEYPAWSPDGSRIAFMAQEPDASGSNPDYNIFVMNADGTGVTRLTDAPGEDGWPAWSPDGSQIVFSSARDDCSISESADCRSTGDIGPWEDAWVMNADGSSQHRLTDGFAQFFAWSPDGDAILVAGAGDMFLIRPDGTGTTPLKMPEVGHPLFPDWIA